MHASTERHDDREEGRGGEKKKTAISEKEREEKKMTERGSGAARSIIDSPGLRELTVCLHERGDCGAAGQTEWDRQRACAARPKQ